MKRALRPPLAALMRCVLRLSGRRRGLVLLYHGVAPASGDPARELVPPIAADLLSAHLRHLRRHYAIVPAAGLRDAVATRRRGQRLPVAITFDDDLPSHLAVAAERLGQAGVHATFFLSGASLDRARSFWWERLQRAFDAGRASALSAGGALPPSVPTDEPRDIHAVSAAVQRLAPEDSRRFNEVLATLAGPDPPDAGIRASDVRALAARGHEIGFHTLHHPRMTELDPGALETALRAGRDELAAAAGTPVTAIAYPHGAADETVANAARAAGFERGYTTRPVPIDPDTDPLLAGRLDTFVLPARRFGFTVARALLAARD